MAAPNPAGACGPLAIDVVFPVYNEGANIANTLGRLAEGLAAVDPGLARFRIVIVHDFDEDDTLPVVERLRPDYPHAIGLMRNPTRGVVHAIRNGLLNSSADYVLVSMADASDDYAILPAMIEQARRGADIVNPSRYMRGGRLHGGPRFKQGLSRWGCVSLAWLTRLPTRDITNSYKLYRRAALEGLQLESTGGFEIGMEITAKVYVRGGRIVELPAQWWDRTAGQSQFRLFQWLPRYLKWYAYLLVRRPLGLRLTPTGRARTRTD